MQNKPNLLDTQTNVTSVTIKNYEENRPPNPPKNKPNSNPIKPNQSQLKPIKPNFKPKQTQLQKGQK